MGHTNRFHFLHWYIKIHKRGNRGGRNDSGRNDNSSDNPKSSSQREGDTTKKLPQLP